MQVEAIVVAVATKGATKWVFRHSAPVHRRPATAPLVLLAGATGTDRSATPSGAAVRPVSGNV